MTEIRDTPTGRQYLGSDGNWYSSEALAPGAQTIPPGPAVPPAPGIYLKPSQAKPKRKVRPIGCLAVIAIVVIIGILIASLSGGGGSSGNVTGTVRNVVPLDGNTVRIYIDWTNHGKAAGSASCAINTTVNNQFGDQVNIRVNSTSSNGNIKPGQSRLLYQDIGVDNNDAQYVKASDVKLVGC